MESNKQVEPCSICGCSCGAGGKKPCPACGCCCGGIKSTIEDDKDPLDLTGYDSSQDPVYDPNSWKSENVVVLEDEEEDGGAGGALKADRKGKHTSGSIDLASASEAFARFGINVSDLKRIEEENKKNKKNKKKRTKQTEEE